MSPKKDVISTVRAPAPIAPYSQGVRAGDYLFITGQISTDVSPQAPVVGQIRDHFEQCVGRYGGRRRLSR
ncbi:unnamed protein product [Medioppia subpectinata]|uniref:Uncharacterized protein n=1 Tax=Medioppia subpectinata TaxID=1979941 RepID=A0A7R9LM89_9ACAR|nr:unnamed protein product [Medioppia subpectinata]CAG2120042.1 unnamed protein product [Medioppia subpectinata]